MTDFNKAIELPYGPEIAKEILEQIVDKMIDCIQRDSKTYVDQDTGTEIIIRSIRSLDREGANHNFTGELVFDSVVYEFEINDGNRNGTEIISWDIIEEYYASY